MLKFIRAIFKTKNAFEAQSQQIFYLTQELVKAKQEAENWRLKYENAKKWIEEISDEFHSYEDGGK